MSGRRHVVKVRIVGEEYSIRSDEAPEHVRAVAEFVDRAIREVMSSGSVIESHRAAILAAMQITDDLFKARADATTTDEALAALGAEVRRVLPPGKRGGE